MTDMRRDYSLSIIVPVYNEFTALGPAIRQIDTFLSENFYDYELILVESGSTDGSYQVCDALAAENPRIRVIHEGSRNGFGSALRLGYKNAVKDLVWLITVDMPFPLGSIFKALPLLATYECVLSYRSEDSRNIFRKGQSFIYNLIIKTFLKLKVRHVNSAFKLYKRNVIQGLDIRSNNWFIDAEIIYRLKENKITYTEIPVVLIDRVTGQSSTGIFTFVAVLKELFSFLKRVKYREGAHR